MGAYREYNCLTDEEVKIAKEPSTKEEEETVVFNKSIPRGADAPFWDRMLYKVIYRLDPLISKRYKKF